MAEKTTFIKLDRNILKWRWYQDGNTLRVFLHLLLTANIKQADFRTEKIKRGSLATSIGHIAKSVGITYSQARTALEHLKETNEIAISTKPRYLVISIVNYDKYQDKPTQIASKSHPNRKQIATESQQSKKYKKGIYTYTQERENPAAAGAVPLSADDVSLFVSEEGLDVDPDAFWNYYEAVGWEVAGKPVRNWKALCRSWDGKPNYSKQQGGKRMTQEEEQAELHRLLDILEQGGNIYDTSGS